MSDQSQFNEVESDLEGGNTMCDNCSKVFPFDDQLQCQECGCVLCERCVEENGEATCDECLDTEESEVE